MFHPHQNFIPCHFFKPAPKLCGPKRPTPPLSKFDYRHPRTDAPTPPAPPTLFRILVKLM